MRSSFDLPMAKKSKVARVSGVEEEDRDRLSALPNDILIHNILSLLPMKQGARTCILARRWRFMPLYLPNLDFDPSEEVARVPPSQRRVFFRRGGEAASRYVGWVDQVIRSYRGKATLHRFRVCFWLDYTFSDKIASWLQFCLDLGVEVLELDALSRGYPWPKGSCKVPLPGPAQLRNLMLLKSLTLGGGLYVASDDLEHILLGCQSLERLQLRELGSLHYVNVSGPISRLKSIHISWCDTPLSITVSAPTPDLVSFIYPPAATSLHLEHAPRLVDLSIGHGSPVTCFDILSHPLSRYFPQLETLCLTTLNWRQQIDRLPHLPSLSRLKCLRLQLLGFLGTKERGWPKKLHGVASLIKAAKCVQHLSLQVNSLDGEVKITEEFASLHLELLRVIELTGFKGRRVDYALASNLIKGAAASASPLEKLIIVCRDIGMYHERRKIEERKSRAKEVIEQELPPTVELVLI